MNEQITGDITIDELFDSINCDKIILKKTNHLYELGKDNIKKIYDMEELE